MDRKIEVGNEYDFRGTVTEVHARDGWVWVAFSSGKNCFRISLPPSALACATLVKRAKRPLAVGDMVRGTGWLDDAPARPIVFIARGAAVLDYGDDGGLSGPYKLTDLRRAEGA